MICLPSNLLEQVDEVVRELQGNRSQFVREAMRFYLMERRRTRLREELIEGYRQMAQLNLQIAEESEVNYDFDLETYERQLASAK
ncbi:MAG: ribbon-helix-helix protein, CopG family [Firmicutes bacterium]|nr:ribbon-helix-helix protein, CopG family [Bacillota bacterium]